MIILGIDPGYERLGIAVIEKKDRAKETLLFSECFKTSASLTHAERLQLIGQEIKKIIFEYQPTVLAMETLFITKNQKTAMKVSETRGVILYEAAQANMKICEYTPPTIKAAVTGHGQSDKHHIMTIIPRLISITKPIAHDDEYDAIAIGLTCAAIERSPLR